MRADRTDDASNPVISFFRSLGVAPVPDIAFLTKPKRALIVVEPSIESAKSGRS
jgi:hypothetical protein